MTKLLIEKFQYKNLRRTTIDGKRHYVGEDGNPVPSVTTILSHSKDMTALNAWKRRVGKAEAQRIVTESANLGTVTHKHLESYIEGVERPAGSNQVYQQAKELSDIKLQFHKSALRFFRYAPAKLKLHRLQTYVRSTNYRAIRWMESCYFKREGLLRNYGPDIKDYYAYGRLYQ